MGRLHEIGKVIVTVYANDHLPPHFHVISPDREALVSIETMEVLRGEAPRGAHGRKAMHWAIANRERIVAEWNRINPCFATA